jgi:hypothetical protein
VLLPAEVLGPRTVLDPATLWPPPPLASLAGFRSRTLVFFLAFGIYLGLLLWVYCLCCLSGTEQQMTPANDIFLRDQVIEPDQFVLAALPPVAH